MVTLFFFFFQVYAETVEPIVPLIFQRTKATCFAYGQTGKYFFLLQSVRTCVIILLYGQLSDQEGLSVLYVFKIMPLCFLLCRLESQNNFNTYNIVLLDFYFNKISCEKIWHQLGILDYSIPESISILMLSFLMVFMVFGL